MRIALRAAPLFLLLLLLLLAACTAAPGEAPPSPRDDAVLEVYDLRDLFSGRDGTAPVFTDPAAADAWAHRRLDFSCWSEGIPVTEWKDRGILVVRAVPGAHARLAAALDEVRAAVR